MRIILPLTLLSICSGIAAADKSVVIGMRNKLHYQDWMTQEQATVMAEGLDKLRVQGDVWTGAEIRNDTLWLFAEVRDGGVIDDMAKLPKEYRDDLGEKLLDQYGTVLLAVYKWVMQDKAQAIRKANPKATAKEIEALLVSDPFIKPSQENKLQVEFRLCESTGKRVKSYRTHLGEKKKDAEEDEEESDDAESRDPE